MTERTARMIARAQRRCAHSQAVQIQENYTWCPRCGAYKNTYVTGSFGLAVFKIEGETISLDGWHFPNYTIGDMLA